MWKPFVTNKLQCWNLYQDAKTWSTRPSILLGIQDPYTAFCLDQAVAYFGNTIHAEMDSVEGKTTEETNRKRRAILTKYLSRDDKPLTQQFADPALMFQ